jgi:hypothetical protein
MAVLLPLFLTQPDKERLQGADPQPVSTKRLFVERRFSFLRQGFLLPEAPLLQTQH